MRRHPITEPLLHRTHAFQIGLARQERPERCVRIVPTGASLFDDAAQVALEHLDRTGHDFPHAGVHLGVAEIGAVGDAQALQVALQRAHPVESLLVRQRPVVAAVGPGDHRQHQGTVGHRAAHRANVLEGLPARDARVALILNTRIERYASHRRLQAIQPGKAGRDADGSAPVAADREGAHSACHGRARAGAGTPGGQVGIPGAAGGGEHRIVTDTAVAELGNVGLAEHYCAGITHALNDDVVLVGNEIGVGRGARHRLHARCADQVFAAPRHAGQGTDRFIRHDALIDPPGRLARQLRGQRAERVQGGVDCVDARQHCIGHFQRRQLLRANQARERDRIHFADFIAVCHDGPPDGG